MFQKWAGQLVPHRDGGVVGSGNPDWRSDYDGYFPELSPDPLGWAGCYGR